jgi:hypothetical protein
MDGTMNRDQLASDRAPFDPQRGVNHAAAAVRVLEKRIARLEAAVFPHQQHINRSRPAVTEVRANGEDHGHHTDTD